MTKREYKRKKYYLDFKISELINEFNQKYNTNIRDIQISNSTELNDGTNFVEIKTTMEVK